MFDWANYLLLAEELAARNDQESALRSAISRAYYAVFCKARDALLREGVQISQAASIHTSVWMTYQQAADAKRRTIGVTGNRLRIDRNRADYRDTFPGLLKTVHGDLAAARNLMESLEKLGSQ